MEHYQVRSFRIAPKLYFNELVLNKTKEVKVTRVSKNHVFCCDISGSMSSTLPRMRQQLKDRIPHIVQPGDTITIIAFAGKNDCVVLKELVRVDDVKRLAELFEAIDRYLRPLGLTNFESPVVKTRQLIENNHSENLWSFLFLSDGGHNESPWDNVVRELNNIKSQISNAVIIEYGYYADSDKLTQMSEILGGSKILASEFEDYSTQFEKIICTNYLPKIKVKISEDVISMDNKYIYLESDLKLISVVSKDDNYIYVPENIDRLYYLSNSIGNSGNKCKYDDSYDTPLYAMAYVYSDILKYDIVESILKLINDGKYIEMYSTAYGKQKLFEFENNLKEAVFDVHHRGSKDNSVTFSKSKFCVLDLITLLIKSDAKIDVLELLNNYNRIGAKAVAKVELDDNDKYKLSKANTKLQLDKVNAEIEENKSVKLDYKPTEASISNLTWNEDRANLSLLFNIPVTLTLPKNKFGLKKVDSFVFRNLTLIKDGILNITELPVFLDDCNRNKLSKIPNNITRVFGTTLIIDLSRLPLINRRYARSVKCSSMTETAYKLMECKFRLKYLGYIKNKYNLKTEPKEKSELDEYLESLGITDKGYQPKTELDKSGDFYMALTLKSTFDKFSSVPKIEDVTGLVKKITPSIKFMKDVIKDIDKEIFFDSNDYMVIRNRVTTLFNKESAYKNMLMIRLSKMKFGLILSRGWFSDRVDFNDNQDSYVSKFGDELTISYKFTETKQNL